MREIPYNVPEFCDSEKHSNKTMLLMKERDRDHADIHDWDCTIYLSKTALIINDYYAWACFFPIILFLVTFYFCVLILITLQNKQINKHILAVLSS